MICLYKQCMLKAANPVTKLIYLLLSCLLSANGLHAEPVYVKAIEATPGGYRTIPDCLSKVTCAYF